MDGILLGLILFIQILQYIVIFDVISSWLLIAGIRFRPKFIAAIIDPMYSQIRSAIPTSIGPFDLTPIIVILILGFTNALILSFFPHLQTYMIG